MRNFKLRSILSSSLLLGGIVPVVAAPPSLTATKPAGLTRGKSVELTFQGANLTGTPEILSPIPLKFTKVDNKDAANWKVQVTVPPDAPLGVFPVRVVSSKGVSNPVLVSVDQVQTVMEVEPNSKFESAQQIPAPAVAEGQAANNDVDFYRFAGRKGQVIVVDAAAARIGSPLDPTIRLTTLKGKKIVASAEDTPGLSTDARIVVTLPEDGEYVVEISDTNYKGTGRAHYRLTVGSVPVAEEVFPVVMTPGATNAVELRGGTLAANDKVIRLAAVPSLVTPYNFLNLDIPVTAIGADAARFEATDEIQLPYKVLEVDVPQVVESDQLKLKKASAPVAFLGRIEKPGDEDMFELAVEPGAKYRVQVQANRIGSALDAVIRVLGTNNAQIATGDDSPLKVPNPPANAPAFTQPDPELEFTAPAGQSQVVLAIKDISQGGGLGYHYRIYVEKSTPGFQLVLPNSQVVVPVGQSALVNFTVDRARGYTGAVKVEPVNPPAGLKFRGGTVPAGATAGLLSIELAAGSKLPPTVLSLVGKGDGGITVPATNATVFASQGPLPVNVLNQIGLLGADSDPAPVGLSVPEASVEVVHGFEGAMPLKLDRKTGGEAALELALVNPPKSVTLAANKVAEKLADFSVVFKAATDAPLGEHELGLTAKGKLAGEDRVVDAPVVRVNIVPPVSFDGLPKEIVIKPGQTFELKGKLNRKPVVKAEVALSVDALPAGLKAEPVKLAPDKSEFVIKITADKAAKAATGNAQVKTAFKAGDKDYPPQSAAVAVKIVP